METNNKEQLLEQIGKLAEKMSLTQLAGYIAYGQGIVDRGMMETRAEKAG